MACSMPTTRISCCRYRMTRWCTASARCYRRCPSTPGSSGPICVCSTVLCTGIQARSCSLWGPNSASGGSGITRANSIGPCSTIRATAAFSSSCAISTSFTADVRRCAGQTLSRPVSSGSIVWIRSTASLPFCAALRGARIWSSPAILRPCRTRTTGSACPRPGAIARCLTAMPKSMAAGASAMAGRWTARRSPATDDGNRRDCGCPPGGAGSRTIRRLSGGHTFSCAPVVSWAILMGTPDCANFGG